MQFQKDKLFIANINYSTSMEKILEIFSKYGNIVDSYKPNGKGFAFLRFEDEDAAAKALEEMNGQELDGRELTITFAHERRKTPRE